jgi:hypothetical protein
MSTSSVATRKCPFCGKSISGLDRRCDHCDSAVMPTTRATLTTEPARPWAGQSAVRRRSGAAPKAGPFRTPLQAPELSVIPKLSALLAAAIGGVSTATHFTAWRWLDQWSTLSAPFRRQTVAAIGAPMGTLFWNLHDTLTGAVSSGLLSATIAAASLLIVCLGLWRGSWWTPRAIMVWASATVGMLAYDYALMGRVQDALVSAQRTAVQGALTSVFGAESAALAQAGYGGRLVEYLFEATLSTSIEAGLFSVWSYYALSVAWFPVLLALYYCRASASCHFKPKP